MSKFVEKKKKNKVISKIILKQLLSVKLLLIDK